MNLFSPTPSGTDQERELTDSLLLKLIFLLLSIIIGSLLGTLLIQLASHFMGMDLRSVLAGLNRESSLAARNYVRFTQLLSQLSTFVIPTLLFAWFFYRRQIWQQLKLIPVPALLLFVYGIMIMLCAFPLTQITYWFNQQIPLPSWMSSMENRAGETIEALLVMESPWVFLFNLTVIALLPALGEELLFRGVLQQQLEKRWARPHLAIWITAFIFSAFHLQFAGFLPRLLLGALLGYLLFWTRSLWIPITAHFVFNGSQVVGHYLFGEELMKTEPDAALEPNWPAALLSLVLLTGLIYFLRRFVDMDRGAGRRHWFKGD